MFAPEGLAEAVAETVVLVAVAEERRSAMFCLASRFVLARRSASCDGEKDHSLN